MGIYYADKAKQIIPTILDKIPLKLRIMCSPSTLKIRWIFWPHFYYFKDVYVTATFCSFTGHSDFSMIDGIAKVKPLVKACVENNMVAMGLTDFTNFCGLVRFYGEALSSGVKPIIGADVLVQSELCGDEPFRFNLIGKK